MQFLKVFLSIALFVSFQAKATEVCWINAVADVPDGVIVYLNDAGNKVIKLNSDKSEVRVDELVLNGKSEMVDSIDLPYGESATVIQIHDSCKITSVNEEQGAGVIVEAYTPPIEEGFPPNTVKKFIPALNEWD